MSDSKRADALANSKDNACPYCGAQATGAHFCSECEKVLPVAAGTDFFSFFGLPRRLRLDEAELEKSLRAQPKTAPRLFYERKPGRAAGEHGAIIYAQ